MAFFKKKRSEEADFSLPPLPEGDELPPLQPLPGEEELPPFPEEVPQPRRMRPAGPAIPETSWQPTPVIERPVATVFVKLDKYRDIMRTVSEIDDKLAELKGTLDRIAAIKSREGEIIDGWAAMLNDAKSRIDDVHSKLTKPEA
jgi:hypothetical protein